MTAKVDKKGKGKAVASSSPEPEQRKEPEVRKRAVPGGEVIQFFNEAESATQRGYNQAKFEDAYGHIATKLKEAEENKKEERERKAKEVERLSEPDNVKAIERIIAELEVTRPKAEAALLKNDCKLRETLIDMISPPTPVRPIAARGA